jgi:hypothetical protein
VTTGSGANTASYTTEPTVIAMDGNLYRCLIIATKVNYDGSGVITYYMENALLTVHKMDTETTLISDNNPSLYGENVTFTATVTSLVATSQIPAGTVEFRVDNGDGAETVLGTGTLNTSGTATFSTSSLIAGTHPIIAYYMGDDYFNVSNSDVLDQVVEKADTATTLTSDINPSMYGQSVIFSATVTDITYGAGILTGNVEFREGATVLGTGKLGASGIATFTTSTLSVGTHPIVAYYMGDNGFNGSNSDVYDQVIMPLKYTVTYNANGGTGSVTDLLSPYNASSVVTVLDKNTMSKTDHTFQGWATTTNGAVVHTQGSSFNITQHTVLYAVWKANTPPPTDPPVTPPVNPPVKPPVKPPVYPPVNPPVDPPVDPPVNPPVDPPVNPPVDPPVDTGQTEIPVVLNPVELDPLPIAMESPIQEMINVLRTEGVPIFNINGMEVPLYAFPGMSDWALINLILAIVGAVIAAITLRRVHSQRQEETTPKHLWIIPVIALAIVGIIVFVLTQDMNAMIVLWDQWTIVNVIVFAGVIITSKLSVKQDKEDLLDIDQDANDENGSLSTAN